MPSGRTTADESARAAWNGSRRGARIALDVARSAGALPGDRRAIIAFAILTGIFSHAVVRNLRVTVVDADRSATSLIYVQAMASAPGVSLAERSGDMTSAMHAIRSGDAIAAVYIPENFERDLIDRKRPQIVVLYNRQYFSPGNSASAAISSALPRRRRHCRTRLPPPEIFRARRPRRRKIRPHQSGAQLRAIPASSDLAARPPCHCRNCRRLCSRLRVLAAQPARLAARRRRQPVDGAGRQTRAAVRHLHCS